MPCALHPETLHYDSELLPTIGRSLGIRQVELTSHLLSSAAFCFAFSKVPLNVISKGGLNSFAKPYVTNLCLIGNLEWTLYYIIFSEAPTFISMNLTQPRQKYREIVQMIFLKVIRGSIETVLHDDLTTPITDVSRNNILIVYW